MFSPKLPLPLSGIVIPRNTLFLGPSPLINPNGILIGSAVFVWVPNALLYNALSMGNKTPQLLLPLRFRHLTGGGPSHSHRQHAQKFGKDRACDSADILADTQTHTDVLTTILRNRFRGRSNYSSSYQFHIHMILINN